MASQLLTTSLTTALLILLSIIVFYLLISHHLTPKASQKPSHDHSKPTTTPEPTPLIKALIAALLNNIILPNNTTSFKKSQNSYWAQQECEIIPSCIVRPSDTTQLSTAVKILKREFDERRKNGDELVGGLFAVRGGGHSPVPGAASINGGVVIDLSRFNSVIVSEDGKSVVIGAGCKWGEVSRILDERGLAVVGGRNSAVGVGGLSLGGKFSSRIQDVNFKN
jgi:hypothetical protein